MRRDERMTDTVWERGQSEFIVDPDHYRAKDPQPSLPKSLRFDEHELESHHRPRGWKEYRVKGQTGVTLVYEGKDPAYELAEPFEQYGDCVYFIHAPELRRVKIGYSNNVAGRLYELQVGAPCELRLIKRIPGGRDLERKIHTKFDAYRVAGEWFSDAVLDEWRAVSDELDIAC